MPRDEAVVAPPPRTARSGEADMDKVIMVVLGIIAFCAVAAVVIALVPILLPVVMVVYLGGKFLGIIK